MTIRFIVLFAIVWASLHNMAKADPGDTHLILHGVSHHSKQRTKGPPWNETNPGIGLRYDFTDNLSGQVGFYKNSFYQQSVYGGFDWTPLHLGPVRLGGFAGIASGYKDKAGFAGGGVVLWQGQKYSFKMRVIPAKTAIYTFEMGYKF